MHSSRFSTRLTVALLVAALVILAHSRQLLAAVQVVACAGLLVWGVFELWNAQRQRHHSSR
jgi:hypothetical protein